MGEPRHFLDIADFDAVALAGMLSAGRAMKEARQGQARGAREAGLPLAGTLLAMIFAKPSTRTRVSFDVAMRQLGGDTLVLSAHEMQIGRGESIADTARVLSRYVDAIMIRAASHQVLMELAEHATVPVINGLTDASHPCQVMADLLTLEEKKGPLRNLSVAWTGDSCNVANSWIHAAGKFGFAMRVASPESLAPGQTIRDWAHDNGVDLTITNDPFRAVSGADCVVTDTWMSMNVEDSTNRHNLLKPYQVNRALMKSAKPDAIFMHCLPAHRGEEVTDEVIDGPQSVVFDEAENRLHIQKSILLHCLRGVS
ncbi:MAG: ornithine carbamoyltransferase [Pseudomonadota bacterium]|nr:ornithine carbamoyltransferase [Pseudomonadota bacterium]